MTVLNDQFQMFEVRLSELRENCDKDINSALELLNSNIIEWNNTIATMLNNKDDLSRRMPKLCKNEFGDLSNNINQFLSMMQKVVAHIVQSAKAIEESTSSIASSTAGVSAGNWSYIKFHK